jgi:hypothetical protein
VPLYDAVYGPRLRLVPGERVLLRIALEAAPDACRSPDSTAGIGDAPAAKVSRSDSKLRVSSVTVRPRRFAA